MEETLKELVIECFKRGIEEEGNQNQMDMLKEVYDKNY